MLDFGWERKEGIIFAVILWSHAAALPTWRLFERYFWNPSSFIFYRFFPTLGSRGDIGMQICNVELWIYVCLGKLCSLGKYSESHRTDTRHSYLVNPNLLGVWNIPFPARYRFWSQWGTFLFCLGLINRDGSNGRIQNGQRLCSTIIQKKNVSKRVFFFNILKYIPMTSVVPEKTAQYFQIECDFRERKSWVFVTLVAVGNLLISSTLFLPSAKLPTSHTTHYICLGFFILLYFLDMIAADCEIDNFLLRISARTAQKNEIIWNGPSKLYLPCSGICSHGKHLINFD